MNFFRIVSMWLNRNRIIIRIAKHLAFWITFFGLLFIFSGFQALNRNFILIDLPITLFYSYIVAYLIIPFFLKKNQLFLLFVSLVLFSLLLSYIRLLNYDYLYYSLYSADLKKLEDGITFPILVLNAKDFSFGMIIFLASKYTFNWLQVENREMKIEKEQLETEVKLLKTQVDPHFLFNTMNNFYSLSVSGNKDLSKNIRKMWGLMDFIVKESNLKEIRLDKELKLISDYIELERLRYGDRLTFELSVTGNLKAYRVPPMILYPFVENCFKHGSALDPYFPWVYISLTEHKDRIRFTARNSIPPSANLSTKIDSDDSGIGNVKKRLQYQLPGRHKLNIEKKNNEFEVVLDIYY